MKKVARSLLASLVASAGFGALAQEPAPAKSDPLESDLEESVAVQLVLIDTVVLDRADRTVPNLTREDFEILVDGKPVSVDTLDSYCAASLDEPLAVRHASKRPGPTESGDVRRIVIALDYMHLGQLAVADVLAQARQMVRHAMTGSDEVMVAAIVGGLRVEQPFTSDRHRVEEALERMEYDISLWNGNYGHLTEEPFFASMEALFTVLGTVSGHKGVVMFSNSQARSDDNDLMFASLAASASSARCSIYPVHAAGLVAERPG